MEKSLIFWSFGEFGKCYRTPGSLQLPINLIIMAEIIGISYVSWINVDIESTILTRIRSIIECNNRRKPVIRFYPVRSTEQVELFTLTPLVQD